MNQERRANAIHTMRPLSFVMSDKKIEPCPGYHLERRGNVGLVLHGHRGETMFEYGRSKIHDIYKAAINRD